MRIATIDIGTNTLLLLIAELREGGALAPIEERATITRLGEGVDKSRVLTRAAIERTNACLSDFAAAIVAAKVDRVGVVGTSAMRDARGGEVVRDHVAALLGVEARVVSGEEEARLTFRGAVSGLELSAGEMTVFDIGGGSTEVVRGTVDARGAAGEISFARSLDVGSVRLTERYVTTDPPSPSEFDALRAAAASSFAEVPAAIAGEIVGIAGTMTTLAAVSLRMVPYDGARVHGHIMLRREIERTVRELAALPLAERRLVPGLEPKRADVIVAGGVIVLALLDRLAADRVRISDRGVRWGLAHALAAEQSLA